MPTSYTFRVNNRPTRWTATAEAADGQTRAHTKPLGWDFEGAGKDDAEALAALRKSMEDFGWFVNGDFTPAT